MPSALLERNRIQCLCGGGSLPPGPGFLAARCAARRSRPTPFAGGAAVSYNAPGTPGAVSARRRLLVALLMIIKNLILTSALSGAITNQPPCKLTSHQLTSIAHRLHPHEVDGLFFCELRIRYVMRTRMPRILTAGVDCSTIPSLKRLYPRVATLHRTEGLCRRDCSLPRPSRIARSQ
jgi:hypothetical protein